ncbi:MAG: pilus assembly protein TadG-related protein [Caenibius sp.]
MVSKALNLLRRLRKCASGNALVLVGIGLPALIGATGYGVDTAQWYMWKRELQHSVDQAAIAGAWALAYDPTTDTYTTRAQQEYTANLNVVADFAVETPDVALANYQGRDG